MLKKVKDSLYSGRDKFISNTLLNLLIVIIVVLFVLEVIFGLKFSGVYVIGPSMEDTLTGAPVTAKTESPKPGGDYIYVDKYADPDYGDVVVVFKDDGSTIIKRVIGLGGDFVKLDRGVLYIKYAGTEEFVLVEEDYVTPSRNTPSVLRNTFPRLSNGKVDENGFYVEEGCMFLLGDNRNESADCRENGGKSYPLSSLYGVVTDWSMKYKTFISSVHQFIYFDLPSFFGLN